MPLLSSAIITLALSILFFCLDRKTKFGAINPFIKQTIIGIFFGLSACYASNLGSVSLNGAILNVRDAAPISAGLIFGPWSGFLSGLIGALNRYFITTPILGLGEYTQLACSIATFVAGIFSGLLRLLLFKQHRPLVLHAIIVTIFVETIHMSLVPFTHLDDLEQATTVVISLYFFLVFSNSIVVGVSIFSTSVLNERFKGGSYIKKITSQDIFFTNDLNYSFQFWLLVLVILAFSVNAFSTYFVYDTMAFKDLERQQISNLEGVHDIGAEDEFSFIKLEIDEIGSILNDWSDPEQEIYCLVDSEGNCINGNEDYEKIANVVDNLEPMQLKRTFLDSEGILVIYDYYDDYRIVDYSYMKYKLFIPHLTNCITIFVQIFVFSLLMLGVYLLLKKLIAEQLDNVNDSLAKITSGNLEEKVNVYTNKEFRILSDSINSTVDTLKHYIELEANRYNKELNLAQQIQLSAIPNVFPPFPERKEIDLYATYKSAKEVGGDFYDYYFIDKDRLVFLIADVSGKGIPAALFMMKAKMAVRMFTDKHKDSALALSSVNDYLCFDNQADVFVTAWLGILNVKTGELQASNAGHNPPVLLRNGKPEFIKSKVNLVLGGMPGISYYTNEYKLNKNDLLYLYTDGITEATNEDLELYGEDRLLKALEGKRPDAFTTTLSVIDDLARFTKGADQADDMTTLSLVFKGE